ncbi:nuclear transport factor 2 family protein [Dactylosporangium sp. NPDC051541]|uniref:nuclear transport factor 2 family protein n=1 Tax=Dactylosporangium sp. NPDC051541 TaxID=3363977 RepID=UPI0037ABE682
MPVAPVPSDSVAQLQWLVDRAAIAQLVDTFARSIDRRDQPTYTDTFTDDARLSLPFGTFEGREQIAAMPTAPPPMASHHVAANVGVQVDGDGATARWNVIATHIFNGADPNGNAQAGGWYDATLRRTPHGWRFSSVALTIAWARGTMIPED